MRNKLGILTFHNVENYGAFCQAYSLQQWLNNKGIDNEIINYKNEKISKPWSIVAFKSKGPVRYILGLAYYIVRMFRIIKFNKARSLLKISKAVSKYQINSQGYSGYIVGSDQVWNFNLTDSDTTYLLDFCQPGDLKFSYAASFGFNDFNEKDKITYLKYLKQFRLIYVREYESKIMLLKSGFNNVGYVMDPVFLHSKQEWLKTISNSKKIKKYILIYQVSYSKKLIQYAKKLKQFTSYSCEIIPFPLGGFIKSNINLTAGPFEWLKLIYNAQYVITDSFHGIAFCIIMNKPFKVILEGVPTRITSLLKTFDLSSHIINKADIDTKISISHLDYNWQKVNEKIEEMKADSEKCLNEIIKNIV
tara:strand:+ start:351 stop:1436 length:1086 start_codon:yes stop_codon:yes gene_type:complete